MAIKYEFDKMVEFLDLAYRAKGTIVPCLVGAPGIGKTAAVKQHAKNVGAGKVVTIIASQILPNEVSGITMPDPEKQAMMIYDHYRLASLEDNDILFFDELLEADSMVLSACLTLIESRKLMSERMLPDIQIIAATNPTIKPNMLKANIRQRFLWKKFDIDRQGTYEFIKKSYGIEVPKSVLGQLVENGDEYNILTPRSLTKMVEWINSAKDNEEATLIAREINASWGMQIGTELLKAYADKVNKPEEQLRNAVRKALEHAGVENADLHNILNVEGAFNSVSMSELMELLTALPDWPAIEAELSSTELVESEVEETIEF